MTDKELILELTKAVIAKNENITNKPTNELGEIASQIFNEIAKEIKNTLSDLEKTNK
ncbi:hypothetical protein CPIN17260_1096 [Campylobacter pinnipediorum subsp. pinnipediorum]|uniref:hypothetical protein n=1 Tax=Campylobacter pinnipediorum TaxID=1965231 RepID=UPI0009C29B5F|nr:hypothetical protein [Campylobacter pinnipediorum]AQW81385.1 hypothetical protein CPIN17260_1096 [Campylobacter pinnipediorum subsp. pinnipediorum]